MPGTRQESGQDLGTPGLTDPSASERNIESDQSGHLGQATRMLTQLSPRKHGGRGAYNVHRRHGETPCELCRLANANYMRLYRLRRRVVAQREATT